MSNNIDIDVQQIKFNKNKNYVKIPLQITLPLDEFQRNFS